MLSSQTFLPRRARAIAAATLLSLAGTTFARDAAAPSPGGWVISRSEGGDGCFMSKSFDHPGATTLLFGLDGDGTNHLTVLNSHWSIKPRDRLKLDFRLTGGAYPGHFAIGLAADGKRGYEAELMGKLEVRSGKIVRFDMVADGNFWGHGTYTGNAPKGRFPFAVGFRLADGTDVADRVPPKGSRGWVQGYIR